MTRHVALFTFGTALCLLSCATTPASAPAPSQPKPDSAPAEPPALPPQAAAPAAEPVPAAIPEAPAPAACDLAPLGEKRGRAELRAAAVNLVQCWVAALNARHAGSLARVYSSSLRYFGDTPPTKTTIAKQLSELEASQLTYAAPHTEVQLDQFDQVTASVALVASSGKSELWWLRFYKTETGLEIGEVADKREQDLATSCARAVDAALSSVPKIRAWYKRNRETGGFEKPLKNGVYEISVGSRGMGTEFSAEVRSGTLRVDQLRSWHLAVSAAQMDKVRKACVPFDSCEEPCRALGQCTPRAGSCVATNDSDCQTSDSCKLFGNCSAGGPNGECIAKSNAVCEALVENCLIGRCKLVGSSCLIREPTQTELEEL